MLTDVMVKYCKMLKPSVKVQEVRLFLESSPCYPSLSSVIDTLLFIGVKAKAVKTDVLNFDEVQSPFLVHLVINGEQVLAIAKSANNTQQLYLYSLKEQKWIVKSIDKLREIWDGIIIFPVGLKQESIRKVSYGKMLSLLIFLAISVGALPIALPSLVSILGLAFSLFLYLKEERHAPTSVTRLCHIGKTVDCDKVIKSNYATIGTIRLVDLSIAYFASQLMVILLSIVTMSSVDIYAIYMPSVIGCLPILAYTVFAQLKIKRICLFCALLQMCLVIEATIALFHKGNMDLSLLVSEGILFFFFLAILWQDHRYKMLKNREEQTKCSLLKFKRDHDILQKRSKRLVLCPDAISIIGNQATDEIVLFLSPECPHCRQALFELMEYMNSNSVCPYNIKLIIASMNKEIAETARNWISLYLTKAIEFKIMLRMWAKGKQLSDFPTFDFLILQKAGLLMQKFQEVAIKNNIHSYPMIAINGILLSEDYSSSDIKYIMIDHIIRKK